MKLSHFCYLLLSAVLLFNCQSPEKPAETATATATTPENVDPKIFQAIMDSSATAWNQGSLDGHLSIYDAEATFMGAKGLIGVPALKESFQKNYFNGTKPNQQLGFSEIQVKALGSEFALITGRFLLSGGGKADQSGRFSLVFGKTANGWKVLHDHSS